MGPQFVTMGHTGSTVPDSEAYYVHRSRYRDILGPQFLILGPPYLTVGHSEPTFPHTGAYWVHRF
jgi:hypothetical protein